MRAFSVLLGLGVLACSSGSSAARPSAPAPTRQDTTRAAGGGQGARQGPAEGPKPYNQVITAGAVTDSGVFIVHRIGEKLFYEVPKTMFGRHFLLVADQRGTMRGIRY